MMRNKKFKILIVFFILLIIGLLLMLKQYNKPHINTKLREADIKINSGKILMDYATNEEQSNKIYTNNIIQITGKIADISTSEGNAIITLKNKQFDAGIICNMLSEENRSTLQLKKGDTITIKGVCTGYLLDVIMVRCVIVK